jgi:hypothetical protein
MNQIKHIIQDWGETRQDEPLAIDKNITHNTRPPSIIPPNDNRQLRLFSPPLSKHDHLRLAEISFITPRLATARLYFIEKELSGRCSGVVEHRGLWDIVVVGRR